MKDFKIAAQYKSYHLYQETWKTLRKDATQQTQYSFDNTSEKSLWRQNYILFKNFEKLETYQTLLYWQENIIKFKRQYGLNHVFFCEGFCKIIKKII